MLEESTTFDPFQPSKLWIYRYLTSTWMEGAQGGTMVHQSFYFFVSTPGNVLVVYIHSWQQEMKKVIMNE